MKRICVPEGMLNAAREGYSHLRFDGAHLEDALEAALGWLAENPILPTDEQLFYVTGNLPVKMGQIVWSERDRALIAEWQRRMFLAPEPEVPEAIRPLLYWHDTPQDARKPFEIDDDQPPGTNAHVNAMILEAYRRGKEGK